MLCQHRQPQLLSYCWWSWLGHGLGDITTHKNLTPWKNSSVQSSKANQPLDTRVKVLEEEVSVAMCQSPAQSPSDDRPHSHVPAPCWWPCGGHWLPQAGRAFLGTSHSSFSGAPGIQSEWQNGHLPWFRVNASSALPFRCCFALPCLPFTGDVHLGLRVSDYQSYGFWCWKWETYLLHLWVEGWAQRCIFVMQISPLFSVIFHCGTDKS